MEGRTGPALRGGTLRPMQWTRWLIFLALVVILGVPFALRPAPERRTAESQAQRLVIVTPHIQQIQYEFGRAFERWHQRQFGTPALVDWRAPGGTSEIVKQLEAQYLSALKKGQYELKGTPEKPEFAMKPGTVGYDLMFGGGSFDHTRLKTGVPFSIAGPDGKPRNVQVPMSEPAGFPQAKLDEWFGKNLVGNQPLYDPEQYWIGTALSSFGIVYNRDVVKRLNVSEPTSFKDLADPRYAGWIALADPRQSGSVTTTLESIMNAYGWDEGWRILREMSANTRYFTNSAPKPPLDVSAGDAAAGLAIDFYGRGQAQAVGGDRVGYSDPKGAVYIDADPITLLRGAPHPELARKFIEFCLTEEAQALWQYPARGTQSATGKPEDWGPERYPLRRMPVRRAMYTPERMAHFADKVDPFVLASETKSRGWRSAIAPMMGCFAIDIADEQRAAWAALNRARATSSFPKDRLAAMERAFYAWPTTRVPGTPERDLEFTPDNFRLIRDSWRDADRMARLKIEYTQFFRDRYREVVALERGEGGV